MQHNQIKFKNDIITCGSRGYKNIKLDNVVDQFGHIIRHNMLMHGQGYGKRYSSQQVLNNHINNNLTNKTEKQFIDTYIKSSKGINVNKKQLCEFYKFFKSNMQKITYYAGNNTKLMKDLLNHFKIKIEIPKQIRVGVGSIAQFVNERKKPYVIGFSLSENDFSTHVYNNRGMKFDKECHNLSCEIKIIKALHERELIDASLCAINDEGNLEEDLGIKPTDTCREIVETSNII